MDFLAAVFHVPDTARAVLLNEGSLVALSLTVAVAGSYAALKALERWRAAERADAGYWQLTSATALGCSFWSVHWIVIVARGLSGALSYAPWQTLLSLLVAIAGAGCSLQIVRSETSWRRVGSAAIMIGLSAAVMHYIGMTAIRFPDSSVYVPNPWGYLALLMIAAATAALWLSLKLETSWERGVAALVMGIGVCGTHSKWMTAAIFQYDRHGQAAPGLPGGPLPTAVALATLVLILCALVFTVTSRRLVISATREADTLRQANARFAQANVELIQSHQQLDAVLGNMTQGVCFFDSRQRLVTSNRRYAEIYGLSPEATRVGLSLEEVMGFRIAVGSAPDMSHASYLASRVQVIDAQQVSDTVAVLKNGRVVAIHHQPLPDGGWVATHEDISERQKAQATTLFMARHDPLTRLPNRTLFNERLEEAMVTAGRGTGCAILWIDLDHFKAVNDTLGHPVGDRLLKIVADRLQACLREGDTLARLGGDEFAVIQLAVDRPDDAEVLANRMLAAFRNMFKVDGHEINVGLSIGITLAPSDGVSSEALLKNADIALYLAKTEGRGTVRFFEPEMDARLHRRRTLEENLQGALARQEFELYYQPLVNLAAGRITGFEALLRWHHPTRGLIPPLDFIPAAEASGLIVEIGAWVLRAACLEAASWPTDISVAVNLSAMQFRRGDLVAFVRAALDASGLRPDRLELEITETVLLKDTAVTLTALHELRHLGIAIALDDFGTGYSSLSYVRRFPFDKIKIDQSFVRDLIEDRGSMAIIHAVAGLGHSLGIKTTAEGVETQEQLERLEAEGCTEVQGYLFSRARPSSELPSLLRTFVATTTPQSKEERIGDERSKSKAVR